MDLSRREDYKTRLHWLTPGDGKGIGNATLRERLKEEFPDDQFTDEDYWDLRNSLIADGLLEKARGKGGSVRRIPAVTEADATTTPERVADEQGIAIARAIVAEASLYDPFQKAIQTGYVPDNDLKPWICEVTASQGRRNTGGLWTRPDITLIAFQTYVYVPGKTFEVITFELKPNIQTAMGGVYGAAAHSAFATRSFLAFPDADECEGDPLFERIQDECERFGLGLILFEDVNNWDTYTFQVGAERKDPDPQAMNDFIKSQISDKSKEEIQRWFR